MMRYLLIISLLSMGLPSLGQNQQQIDSLLLLKDNEKNEVAKGLLLLDLANQYINTQRTKSDSLATIALEIGKQHQDIDLTTKALNLLGYISYKDEKDNISLSYYKQLDSMLNQHGLKNELLIKSKLYQSQIAKFTFTEQGMIRAREYLDEMLTIAKEISSDHFEHLAYSYIGQWHVVYAGEHDKEINLNLGLENYNKALKYFLDQQDTVNISKTYWSMSSVAKKQEDFEAAESYLHKRVALLTGGNDVLELANAYSALASFQYNNLARYDDALENYENAMKIYNIQGFQNANYKLDVLNGLAFSHKKLGNYDTAFEYLDQAYLLKDSLDRNRSRQATIELETKYQTEKKEQEIALLTSKNQLAEQQKANQRNLLLGGMGLTTLAGIFLFFLYRNRQKTTKKLRELDKAKSNFFANISHEFRTPLTLITGPVQQQLKKKALPNDERHDLEMVYRNSSRLLALVDQLLDISKIESGSLKLYIAQGKLTPFLGTLTDSFTYGAQQKGLKYIVNNHPHENEVWYDRDILEKVVMNLLANALKYTDPKGTVVCTARIKDNKLHLEVKNTGPGLSAQDLEKIFQRFYQVNDDAQGVGIGLSLIKELVSLHKGTITVESVPGEWTTFNVTLPIGKSYFSKNEMVTNIIREDVPRVSNPQNIPVHHDFTDDKIVFDLDTNMDIPILLIVDDNADIREYVGNLFNKEYEVVTANNGKEGIDQAQNLIPDMIISDIMMPVIDGITLCNTLKEDERTSHIPIVLLTAKAGEENQLEGIKTGADAYITKPFNDEMLQVQIDKLIESRKQLHARFSQEVILKPLDIAITPVDERFLGRIQEVLDQKVTESNFSTEEFSKAVGMSRMQLHRKLKALTGLSASEFIRSQRLQLAAQLLTETDTQISQVGYAVGFNDPSYFAKCFKAQYHCTPSEYADEK